MLTDALLTPHDPLTPLPTPPSALGETLWLPNTPRPEWLDGSLPGDRGFDPLGLSKPTSYIQMDLDALDQNSAVNKAGGVVGSFASNADEVSPDALAPYSEVFGLARFRENEVIHGRWAMLATLGVIVAEASTGVAWQDAGKVELDGAQYLGFPLPFTLTQLVWIEALLVGGAEVYRNTELDTEKRAYPGGWFDPLRLASGDDNRAFKLKEAELKHGRLAMVGCGAGGGGDVWGGAGKCIGRDCARLAPGKDEVRAAVPGDQPPD